MTEAGYPTGVGWPTKWLEAKPETMSLEKVKYLLVSIGLVLILSACGGQIAKAPVVPQATPISFGETELLYQEEGFASWYGPGFYGHKTASGERFTKKKFTCAHRKLPFGTRLEVTNLENGKTVEVIVNDRGPFVYSRMLDLSFAAAKELGIVKNGQAKVKVKQVFLAKE